jgi:hypothetical protein
VITRNFFCLLNLQFCLSLETYLYDNAHSPLSDSRMLLSFLALFAHAYMNIIMLSYHSSFLQTLSPLLPLPFNSSVCMSLTLTVVQYERSTVRHHHHHLLILIAPTVPANKYIYTRLAQSNSKNILLSVYETASIRGL